MKTCCCNLMLCASLLLSARVPAAVFYVDAGGTNPVAPYSTWATAATAIQDAVGLATNGDTVLVTNGTYQTGGYREIGADITNRVAILNAVTVRSVNGPLVTIIRGYQPSAASNALNAVRCALVQDGAILGGFTLTGGQAGTDNYVNGGGVTGSLSGLVSNCIITGNRSGGAGGGAYLCTLVNCLVTSNTAVSGGGLGGASAYNCTVVNNNATNFGGGVYAGSTYNSIVFYNTATTAGSSNYYLARTYYCCTLPFPAVNGVNDIGSTPAFLNFAGGDFHLQLGSPCIDAGTNGYVQTTNDLDGDPRIVNGTVDMGAYENQNTATVHFVNVLSEKPVAPYTSWATAATAIQDAVDVAGAGDIVVVDDGEYFLGGVLMGGLETNRVAITNAITVESLDGPLETSIRGGLQTRCAYVGSNAVLSGFTLTAGQAAVGDYTNDQSGTGAWCQPGGVISNCIFSANKSLGTYGYGGGDYGGTVVNSVLSNNTAGNGGGAANAVLVNCTVVANIGQYGSGGGLYQVTATDCLISSNSAPSGAGGTLGSTLYNCTLTGNMGLAGGATSGGANYNCTITGNLAVNGGGTYQSTNFSCLISSNTAAHGNGGGAYQGNVYNCVLEGNQSTTIRGAGGEGGGIYSAGVINCTLVSNSADVQGGGAWGGTLYNSIIYYNNSPTGSNYFGSGLGSCCTTPQGPSYPGGCFTNPPVFVNLAAGDFHEQTNSPTINSGSNAYVTGSVYPPFPLLTNDLDGNPRIVGGTVDVGAFEYQGSNLGVPIPIPWLVQYGLPTDGSEDYAYSDSSGMNNWQKWFAGLVPGDSASVLRMHSPEPEGARIVVTWQSVSNRTYYLQRASSLPGGFETVVTVVQGKVDTTSYTDTNAPAPGPYFYRVGVNSL